MRPLLRPIFETFTFSDDAKIAFDELKQALASSPVLTNPDFSRPFFIQCDASNVGIGGVLFQVEEDVGEHPLAFFSKKLSPAEKKYSVTERECLAVGKSIIKFRGYIEFMIFQL